MLRGDFCQNPRAVSHEAETPQLAPPGAGVPRWQMLAGRHLLLPWYGRLSWDAARDLHDREGRALVRLADGRDERELSRRVLVPPQIGLEDSSRHWSYAMVLEHLVIIGDRVVDVVVELTHGRVPRGAVRTEQLKPAGETTPPAAIDGFLGFLERLRRATADPTADRDAAGRFPHPWFGPLSARRWLAFLPMHQRIHVRQARRILGG
jgi:hypothetical protein